jgi:hypothetical protein
VESLDCAANQDESAVMLSRLVAAAMQILERVREFIDCPRVCLGVYKRKEAPGEKRGALFRRSRRLPISEYCVKIGEWPPREDSNYFFATLFRFCNKMQCSKQRVQMSVR